MQPENCENSAPGFSENVDSLFGEAPIVVVPSSSEEQESKEVDALQAFID